MATPLPPLPAPRPGPSEGVAGLQLAGFGAVRLLVPFHLEAGTVTCDHPLQAMTVPFAAAAGGGKRIYPTICGYSVLESPK